MLGYLLFGLSLGFAAAVQPGPMTAFVISQALSGGWRRALPKAFAPLLSDGPVAAVALAVLSGIPAGFVHVLRLSGGVVVLVLAAGAARAWRRFDPGAPPPAPAARGVLAAAAVNLLNPNAYLGWSLVLGPMVLKGWRESPARGIVAVGSFYATMVVTLATLVLVFHAARRLGPRVNRAMIGLSAIALAGFGGYMLWTGVTR